MCLVKSVFTVGCGVIIKPFEMQHRTLCITTPKSVFCIESAVLLKECIQLVTFFCEVVVHEAVSTEADSATSINTPRRQISSSVLLEFLKWFTLFVAGT